MMCTAIVTGIPPVETGTAPTDSARVSSISARIKEITNQRCQLLREQKEALKEVRKERAARLKRILEQKKEKQKNRQKNKAANKKKITAREVARARREKRQAALFARKKSKEARRARNEFVAKPWAAQGKLPNRAFPIYTSEHYANAASASPTSKPMEVIGHLRAQYKALTPEQRAPYEAKAQANRAARQAAKAITGGLRITPYALFLKDNYATVSAQIPGADGPKKIPAIAKAMSIKWKELSLEARVAYKNKAESLRAEAQKNVASAMQEQSQPA
jgi:predicted phage gp36 major capsid-like protein